jgi:hypothetical protein
MNDYTCGHCGREAELRRREYKVLNSVRYHVGVYCTRCKRFTLPWLKQRVEHVDLPVIVDDVVPIAELINPSLFERLR